MTGRPGHRTMEMNGKSTVSYLVRTPRVPFFMLILIGLAGSKEPFSFPGATWDHFRCTVEPLPGHIRCRILFQFQPFLATGMVATARPVRALGPPTLSPTLLAFVDVDHHRSFAHRTKRRAPPGESSCQNGHERKPSPNPGTRVSLVTSSPR